MNKHIDRLSCPICSSNIKLKPFEFELKKFGNTISCGLKKIDYTCEGMPKHVFSSLTVSISKSNPPKIVDYELSNIIMSEEDKNE